MPLDVAIKVEHVSKSFKLPHEKSSSIKSLAVNFYRRRKGYTVQKALQDVSFEVKKGEFFGIVGRNGSGKSTLLKLLAGIYTPETGHIQVNGKLTPFIELGVGFNPELSGRENVYLNGALLGFNRGQMDAMYQDIVNFAELHDFMEQKLKNYSSGMQVRLAFSIAIRAQTEILLLDEVLAVGDTAFQNKCINYFKQVKQEGKTVIFVSHDMSSIAKFCDRVLVMDRGTMDGIYDAETGVHRYEDFNLRSEVKDLQESISSKEAAPTQEHDDGKHVIKEIMIKTSEGKDAITLGGALKGMLLLDGEAMHRQLGEEKFSCAVTIFNQEEVLVASLQTPQEYSWRDTLLTFTVKDIALTPGLYTSYAGVYAKDADRGVRQLDTTDFPAGFGVESQGNSYTDGVVQIKATWKVTSLKNEAQHD